MLNIEYKAELQDAALAEAIVKRMGATFIKTLEQTDTYYRVPSGRLKKRECPGEPEEWIAYDRPNDPAARASDYRLMSAQDARERYGERPLPIWLQVRKVRQFYMLGSTRIHIDDVDQLGRFIEFEALVSKSHTIEACHASITKLLDKLGPVMGEPISSSYSDLMARELEMDAFDQSRGEP